MSSIEENRGVTSSLAKCVIHIPSCHFLHWRDSICFVDLLQTEYQGTGQHKIVSSGLLSSRGIMAITITPIEPKDIPGVVECIQKAFEGDPYREWVFDKNNVCSSFYGFHPW